VITNEVQYRATKAHLGRFVIVVLRLFHLMTIVARVTTSTEIRPGTVRERELALIERALARTGNSVERGAQLVILLEARSTCRARSPTR